MAAYMGTLVDSVLSNLMSSYGGNIHNVRIAAIDILKFYPSLRPELGTYTHPTGSVSRLLVLRGTIPINYMGSTYNIPIDFWFPGVNFS